MAKRDNIRRALARARVARRQWVDVPGVPNARAFVDQYARPDWWRSLEGDKARAVRAAQADRRILPGPHTACGPAAERARGLDVADDLLPKPGAHYREQAARGILDRFGGGRA